MITRDFWVVVDKDNNPIDIDQSSGGYPYVPTDPFNAYYWNTEVESTKYCDIINYGNKGYRIVTATITINN